MKQMSKAPTKKKIEQVSTHLAWNFLQVLSPDIIEELSKQLNELVDGKDAASDFVKIDPEGSVLFSVLKGGLDKLKDAAELSEWKPAEVFATAWMIRDLVVETSQKQDSNIIID